MAGNFDLFKMISSRAYYQTMLVVVLLTIYKHVILNLFITLAAEKFTLLFEYESQVLALSCALDVPD